MATSNDTYHGALEVLAKQISGMMGLADANLPFCIQLLELVTQERRSPELAMQQAGVVPPPAQNPQGADQLGLPPGMGGGMPPDMGGGMGAPPPSFLGAGNGGPMQQAPAPPNPDELRRILTSGG